jgi:hypothetical protein
MAPATSPPCTPSSSATDVAAVETADTAEAKLAVVSTDETLD